MHLPNQVSDEHVFTQATAILTCAGMHMYVVMEQAMIGKTPDKTLAIYSQHRTLYVKLIYSKFLIASLFLTTPLATNPC